VSVSVVFDSPLPVPEPVDATCVTGAEGARGGCDGVVGSAPGIGGRDGMHSGMEGISTIDLVELGLFVHASSSKPDRTAGFDLTGACTSEVAVVVVVTTFGAVIEVAMSGVVERVICSEAVEMALRLARVAYGKVY
jgi:hypothetical protein